MNIQKIVTILQQCTNQHHPALVQGRLFLTGPDGQQSWIGSLKIFMGSYKRPDNLDTLLFESATGSSVSCQVQPCRLISCHQSSTTMGSLLK
jgi:hypothetical protein